MSELKLHRLVWGNHSVALRELLEHQQLDLEQLDPHGRTPLRLAVTLGHRESVEVLLEFGADVSCVDKEGWTAVHDATCRGDRQLLATILNSRNFKLQEQTQDRIPELLQLLDETPDFEVDMKWDFSSWVPLVSGMCPSDVCHIWKKGNQLRFDMTLLGFENMRWVRGSRSVVYSTQHRRTGDDGGTNIVTTMTLIDHDHRSAMETRVQASTGGQPSSVGEEELEFRLSNPVTTTHMDEDKVSFSRLQSGIWGFQRDRVDEIDGYQCQVYGASGIQLETKTRVEHLPSSHAARRKGRNPVTQVMAAVTGGNEDDVDVMTAPCFAGDNGDNDDDDDNHAAGEEDALVTAEPQAASKQVSFQDYIATGGRRAPTIGRKREVKTKKQTIKMTLWMSNDFPLSFKEQVLPIIDLLAPTNRHIAKLRDFISLQLPAGFPVKIEVPVYHVLTARVSFENFTAECNDAEGTVFVIPDGYRRVQPGHDHYDNEEDIMLAMALQASMQGYGPDGGFGSDEGYDADLQRAIQASLDNDDVAADGLPAAMTARPAALRPVTEEDLLQQAIALSLQDQGGAAPSSDTSALSASSGQPDYSRMTEEEQLAAVLALSQNDQ
eukprot:TRINITY_DN10487_c0_g2_i2.p1 TRINITY_DN10487_c0_g2~~TRINITY_DN10487_c0_g2_i2.p1  ORF type:complete len:607 (+),score=179.69 TRINITY_DN10487_c0_g2_i2:173-1993(+)